MDRRALTRVIDRPHAERKLPADAIVPWARYCAGRVLDPVGAGQLIAPLRNVVANAPGFANGWAALVEMLFSDSIEGSGDRAALRREALAAADHALAIDPQTAGAWVAKGWLEIGIAGDDPAAGKAHRFGDFAKWKHLADLSTAARPSDCGCEIQQYGFVLEQMGRASAALPWYERARANEPRSPTHIRTLANALVERGRFGEAETILTELSQDFGDPPRLIDDRLNLALSRGDWRGAQALATKLPETPYTRLRGELLAALVAGDRTTVTRAGDDLAALAAGDRGLDRAVVRLRAVAGRPSEAIRTAARLLDRDGIGHITLLYGPLFAQARRLPEFAELGARMNLLGYWRDPATRADFCAEPDAPPLCRAPSRAT